VLRATNKHDHTDDRDKHDEHANKGPREGARRDSLHVGGQQVDHH